MNIFKRLFKRKKTKVKKSEKNQECWYNNAHEDPSSKLGIPMEGAALSSPNQVYMGLSKRS